MAFRTSSRHWDFIFNILLGNIVQISVPISPPKKSHTSFKKSEEENKREKRTQKNGEAASLRLFTIENTSSSSFTSVVWDSRFWCIHTRILFGKFWHQQLSQKVYFLSTHSNFFKLGFAGQQRRIGTQHFGIVGNVFGIRHCFGLHWIRLNCSQAQRKLFGF